MLKRFSTVAALTMLVGLGVPAEAQVAARSPAAPAPTMTSGTCIEFFAVSRDDRAHNVSIEPIQRRPQAANDESFVVMPPLCCERAPPPPCNARRALVRYSLVHGAFALGLGLLPLRPLSLRSLSARGSRENRRHQLRRRFIRHRGLTLKLTVNRRWEGNVGNNERSRRQGVGGELFLQSRIELTHEAPFL
jgi:hypothetical protein